MFAILSDVHGNLEALEAVLADAAAHGAERVCCLGDLIGYGPDPLPCLELARGWDVVLQGNFEAAALLNDDLPGLPDALARTILRFRDELHAHADARSLAKFLSGLPTRATVDDALCVHGSPRNHLHEHLFPEDVYNQRKMLEIASRFDTLCFCGRTHIPGVFQEDAGDWTFMTPDECQHRHPPTGRKVICNVGSVGQPRDADPRACYVLYTSGEIVFRRVAYDVDRTIRKLRDRGDDFFGAPIREG